MIKKIILLTFSFILNHFIFAQSFEAKVITGFAASQIDGDALAGYNQLGAVLGFATNFEVAKKMKFQQEIVYYGRGSRIGSNKGTASPFIYKGLHYLDINGILSYNLDKKLLLQAGLGYGNLMYLRTDGTDNSENYKGDLFWTAGIGYYLNDNIIGVGRFQYSLPSIHKYRLAYNNTISFGVRFIL